jgi:protein-L-isoaspartate(D-aspartate) O-methyltransferase
MKTAKWAAAFLLAGCLCLISPAACQEDDFALLRRRMVERHLKPRDITDKRVLEAMGTVPRHSFVSPTYRHLAYADHPLPIGDGQTISQPYIVALMTQLLEPRPGEKILEIGTGSGYQAAVLAHLEADVYTVEIIRSLAEKAGAVLAELGYDSVHVKWSDGSEGWEDEAPFDAAIITCATAEVPPQIFAQVREGGRIVVPLGDPSTYQTLCVISKRDGKPHKERAISVRFVPMTGKKR